MSWEFWGNPSFWARWPCCGRGRAKQKSYKPKRALHAVALTCDAWLEAGKLHSTQVECGLSCLAKRQSIFLSIVKAQCHQRVLFVQKENKKDVSWHLRPIFSNFPICPQRYAVRMNFAMASQPWHSWRHLLLLPEVRAGPKSYPCKGAVLRCSRCQRPAAVASPWSMNQLPIISADSVASFLWPDCIYSEILSFGAPRKNFVVS